jgi:hypothetical protein
MASGGDVVLAVAATRNTNELWRDPALARRCGGHEAEL